VKGIGLHYNKDAVGSHIDHEESVRKRSIILIQKICSQREELTEKSFQLKIEELTETCF
jgi:hypothetical protein